MSGKISDFFRSLFSYDMEKQVYQKYRNNTPGHAPTSSDNGNEPPSPQEPGGNPASAQHNAGKDAVQQSPEPALEQAAEPPVQQPQEPVSEQATEPPVQQPQKPVSKQATEPPVQQPPEPVSEQATEPPVQQSQEPVSKQAAEPPVQQPPEPVSEQVAKPPVQQPQEPVVSESRTYPKSRLYKGEFPPERRLVLWGWDEQHDPGFIIFYGSQKFKSEEGDVHELHDNADYSSYCIFRGQDGHLPSFEAVGIRLNYQTRTNYMSYKKDLPQYGASSQQLEDFHSLKKPISVPYFTELSHAEYAAYFRALNGKLDNFEIAQSPDQILGLGDTLAPYRSSLIQMFSYPSLYMRKKALSEILNTNPPEAFYELVMRMGSSEVIAGLLLELAKRGDGRLSEEAEQLDRLEIPWLTESYAKGLKRCAQLYLRSLRADSRADQAQMIRSHLPEMNLRLIKVFKKQLPDDICLEGRTYKKYAAQGAFTEFTGHYVQENGKYQYVRERRSAFYQPGYYTDGVAPSVNRFKSTIQESEIYGLADVIGKTAYHMDAPNVAYFFSGSGHGKALQYFRRYLRRILNSYAQNDESKYIEAMRVLFTSYTSADYLSAYPGNFQENRFIKQFLYHDFHGTRPNGWHEGYLWSSNDQLLRLKGRYEFRKDIWDRHLDTVIDILCEAKIEVILKAFYYMLKDSEQGETVLNQLPYAKLVALADSPYEPAAQLAVDLLSKRLNATVVFNSAIMSDLMNCTNPAVYRLALDYLSRTNGKLSALTLCGLMLSGHLEQWKELFEQSIHHMEPEEYLSLLLEIVRASERFIQAETAYSKETTDTLDRILDKTDTLSTGQKAELFTAVTKLLLTLNESAGFLFEFLEKMLFSIPLEELKVIMADVPPVQPDAPVLQRSGMILSFLYAIKQEELPLDQQVTEILAVGTSRMVRVLVDLTAGLRTQLAGRPSTLLILSESDVSSLNEIAKSVFSDMEGDAQKKVHLMLMDSPDSKTYEYAIQSLYTLYEKPGERIPQEFILHMFEHASHEVRAFISGKVYDAIENFGNGDEELFLYYVRTLLLLPNKVSAGKDAIYQVLPAFVHKFPEKRFAVESLLLEIGGSNIILDSERALVSLAKIRKEAV